MGKSHAEAAAEFKLTQPRVTQIVEQVRDWMTQVNRGEEYGYTDIQMLRLAEETLRIQLDGWMRMAMQEWHKSCQEKYGRTTFLGQAGRFAMNLARLAGVDVTGKTARAKAEQQAREEALQRLQAAEKALWDNQPRSEPTSSPSCASIKASSSAADTCAMEPAAEREILELRNHEKNSYGLAGSARVSDPAGTPDLRPTEPKPVSVDKPIPKFLDKKVHKRLLAMRREKARRAMLVAVG